MESLFLAYFSSEQKDIIDKRRQHMTYDSISADMARKTGKSYYHRHISACLLRSAMGLHWHLGQDPGDNPYLCPQDLIALKETINSAELGSPMDAMEVLDEAYKLKGERLAWGVDMLTTLKCSELNSQLTNIQFEPPKRQWLNGVLDELEAQIRNRRYIDPKRLEACSYEVIDTFFISFSSKLQSFSKYLMFGADETMVSTCVCVM